MKLTPSMELRLIHIETALDVALKENNTAMIQTVKKNAEKMLAGNNRSLGMFQEVAKRLDAMLDKINARPLF